MVILDAAYSRLDRHVMSPGLSNEVWVVLPSANPENCHRNLPHWREMGYRIAVLQDTVRFEVQADAVLESDRYEGWAWAVNRLCAEVVPSDCRVVVAAGDDMLPDPERTAQQIADDYLTRFPDGFGVMQPTGDPYLLSQTYCGSPWFGRGWINHAFGGRGPMPTGYRHNWADMELHWVARGMGVLWARDDLTQRHEHFTRLPSTPAPQYWTDSASGFDVADCERFIERAWSGFPGCDPVSALGIKYDHSVFRRAYRSIAEVHLHRQTGRSPWDACRRVREAFELCAHRGWFRIGLFGNGAHTEAVWEEVQRSKIRPAVILDDHAPPQAHRQGVPVCAPGAGKQFGLQAIVISGNSVEDQLVDRALGLGVPIVRLYGGSSPQVIDPAERSQAAIGGVR